MGKTRAGSIHSTTCASINMTSGVSSERLLKRWGGKKREPVAYLARWRWQLGAVGVDGLEGIAATDGWSAAGWAELRTQA